MVDKHDIIQAWARIRTNDNTIPDDVLDFMKNSALDALKNKELNLNLAIKIRKFVKDYAILAANQDEDEPRYNSPDAHELLACAKLLEQGFKPMKCWSDYGQGGYKRTDEGRKIHDELIKEIYKIINNK